MIRGEIDMELYTQTDEPKKSVQKNKDFRNIDDTIDFYMDEKIQVKKLRDKTSMILEDLSGTNLGYLLQKIQTTNDIPDLFLYVGLTLFLISTKKETSSKKKTDVLLMIKRIMDLHNL